MVSGECAWELVWERVLLKWGFVEKEWRGLRECVWMGARYSAEKGFWLENRGSLEREGALVAI